IRSFQSIPDVVVLHDPMVLPLEQSRSLPFRWNPELEARQPCVRSAIGVLEHAIAEPSGPPKLKKKFAHSTEILATRPVDDCPPLRDLPIERSWSPGIAPARSLAGS